MPRFCVAIRQNITKMETGKQTPVENTKSHVLLESHSNICLKYLKSLVYIEILSGSTLEVGAAGIIVTFLQKTLSLKL